MLSRSSAGVPCLVAGPNRTEMRQKYGLAEAPVTDMIAHLPVRLSCSSHASCHLPDMFPAACIAPLLLTMYATFPCSCTHASAQG